MNNFDIFFDQINNCYQVRTKTNVTIIEFNDPQKEAFFNSLVKLYQKKEILSYQDILKKTTDCDLSKKIEVLKELINCEILNHDNFTPSDEINELVLDYDISRSITPEKQHLISYIGDLTFGNQVQSKIINNKDNLEIYSIDKISSIDLENIVQRSDFLIVDTLKWNPSKMESLNSSALKYNKPWLLIEGLNTSNLFSIGPIFYGKYTGCYTCYINRLRSNNEYLQYYDSYVNYLKQEAKSTSIDLSILDSTKDIAATIVVSELYKFLHNWYPPETWKCCLMINQYNYLIEKHSFIKAPICDSCKPSIDYNPAPWLESVTLREFPDE